MQLQLTFQIIYVMSGPIAMHSIHWSIVMWISMASSFVLPVVTWQYIPEEPHALHVTEVLNGSCSRSKDGEEKPRRRNMFVEALGFGIAENGSLRLPSKAFWFMAFDIWFIASFVVGWIMTLVFNPEVLSDNPILRVFSVNNICIGVDVGPARLVANVCWGVMLFPMAMFGFTSYLHMRAYGMKEHIVQMQKVLLFLGYIAAMCFGLAFGIQPRVDDAFSVLTHFFGFTMGLFGYSLLRLTEVVGYINQHPKPWPKGGQFYLFVLILHFLWAFVQIFSMLPVFFFGDVAGNLHHTPKGSDPTMMIVMWAWTFGILSLPFITWKYMPEDAHVFEIGATSRTNRDYIIVEEGGKTGFNCV